MARGTGLTALVVSASVLTLCAVGSTGCGSEAGADALSRPDVPLPDRQADPPAADDAPPICAEASGQYTAVREPSNVLFLLDRSGSMHIKLPSGQTRWQSTKKGLVDLLGVLPATTRAGMMMFPQ